MDSIELPILNVGVTEVCVSKFNPMPIPAAGVVLVYPVNVNCLFIVLPVGVASKKLKLVGELVGTLDELGINTVCEETILSIAGVVNTVCCDVTPPDASKIKLSVLKLPV